MKEIEFVKKYSGWKKVQLLSYDGFKFYFESPFGELNELSNIKYFYAGQIKEYIIAIAQNSYYIGYWYDEKTIYCFAECETLQEACEGF